MLKDMTRNQSDVTKTFPGPNGAAVDAGKSDDQVHTVGVSADWHPIEDLLKIGSNLNVPYGDVGYDVRDGLTPVEATIFGNQGYVIRALPNVKSQLCCCRGMPTQATASM